MFDEFERGVGVISGCLHLPSAERVLRALGLADDWAALEASRCFGRRLVPVSWPARSDMGAGADGCLRALRAAGGWPVGMIEIDGLRAALLGSLRPASVRWGRRVVDVRADPKTGRVWLCTARGGRGGRHGRGGLAPPPPAGSLLYIRAWRRHR